MFWVTNFWHVFLATANYNFDESSDDDEDMEMYDNNPEDADYDDNGPTYDSDLDDTPKRKPAPAP